MKYLFIVHKENDEFNKITGVNYQDDDYVLKENQFGIIETKNPDLFYLVSDLVKKTIIRYPSNLKKEITKEDLIIADVDQLEMYKIHVLHSAQRVVSNRVTPLTNFVYFEFCLLNNYFMNKGIFITDENRQDKYLEIINTKDEEMINKLESYLNTIDELQSDMSFFYLYKDFETTVKSSTEIKEIDEALMVFRKNFK